MDNDLSREIISNGYTFTTDENGSVTAKGQLQNEAADRNGTMQVNAGGSARLATDDGGHLIAARANGPAIEENLSAQDSSLNRSSYKAMENAELRAIQNGAVIHTERTSFVSNDISEDGSRRPDAYMINDNIHFADGRTQDVHLSFSNLSKNEQSQMNELSSGLFDTIESNPEDGLRAQMSTQEYSQLMEETDQYLPSIGDEYSEWDVSTANDYMGSVAIDDSGLSNDASEGYDTGVGGIDNSGDSSPSSESDGEDSSEGSD